MVSVTHYGPHRKTPAFSNGLEWVAHKEAAIKGFYCFWGTRMGTEKERRGERQGIHKHEHDCFHAATLDETKARYWRLSEQGITFNGKSATNFCYVYFHGPTMKAREIIEAAYRSLTTRIDLQQFMVQRRVINGELEMYRTQSVWDQLHDKVLKALYGDTPYGATWGELVGNVPKLSPTRVAGIERIFRPQNLVIVTMGRLDDEQIFPYLERTFGSLAKQPAVHAPQCSLPPREPFRQELLHPCMTIPFVHQVVRCGPPEPEGLARVQLLADILTRDYTSPLYWNLCEVDGDTYVPFTTVSYGRPENLLHLEYSAAEEDIDPILGKVGGELEKLAQRQIPISDFRRLQRWSVNAARDALDDPVELAEWYITNSAVRRFVRPREYLDMIRGISREELGDAVAQWREGMGTIIFKPAPGAADHEVLR